MSGPKGTSVRVVSAAELEARALTQARARLQQTARRAEQLAAELAAARGRGIAAPPLSAIPRSWPRTSGACKDLADRIGAELVATQAELGRLVCADRARSVLAAMSGSSASDGPAVTVDLRESVRQRREAATTGRSGSVGTPAGGTTPSRPSESEHVARARIAAAVEKALARLQIDDEATHELDRLAGEVLAAPSTARAETLLRVLQDDVQNYNRRAALRKANRAELEGLRESLLGLDPATCAPVLQDLEALLVAGATVSAQLAEEVTRVRARCTANADRRFALEVAAACLEELGYEVEDAFDTVVATDGLTYLRRAGWPGYAVQVRSTPGRAELGFNVVRSSAAAADPVRGAEIETQWCTHFERLQERARDRGVDLMLTRSERPGALPLQQVADQRLAGAAARQRRAATLQQRHHPAP